MNKFINILKNRKRIKKKLRKISKIKKYILENLESNSFLYTSLNTPIFTVRCDKYIYLQKELLKNKLVLESCKCFENLNSKYARVRISKNYKKVTKILKKVLS